MRKIFLLITLILLCPACSQNPLNSKLPSPVSKPQEPSVWLEDLSSAQVASSLQSGSTRVIIPTGGVEQNGPYLALGKHNFILEFICERLARRLENTMVAPIVKYVPEGQIEPAQGHMRHPGTLSLRPETFDAMLEDIVRSLRAHGYKEIILLGDSGGNQDGMKRVAEKLNPLWSDCRVHFLAEFYDYDGVRTWLRGQGYQEHEPLHHEEIAFTAQVAVLHPEALRFDERVTDDGTFELNGVTFEGLAELRELGRDIMDWRVERCVEAMQGLGLDSQSR